MKHINYKIETLLHEGFSMKTLENFNSKQIDLLYEKTKKIKKEPKEEVTKTIKQYNLGDKTDKDKFLDATKAVADKNKVNFDPKTDTASIGETEIQEKSVSKQQQKIMGLALSVKRGDTPKSKVTKSVKDMATKMSEKDLEDFASTKHKGLPKKVESKEGSEKFIQKATKKMGTKGTEGKFGRWCKKEGLDSDGEVTKKCISAAMKSDDPSVVKMANFAKNIGGFKGSEHKKKTESKENIKKLEENILRLIEDHLPPHTTKGELLSAIKGNNR